MELQQDTWQMWVTFVGVCFRVAVLVDSLFCTI